MANPGNRFDHHRISGQDAFVDRLSARLACGDRTKLHSAERSLGALDTDVITDDDIRRAVAPNAFQAGLQYQEERRVQNLQVAPDGVTLSAQVRGSRRSPYRQSIRLVPGRSGNVSTSGSCTCPVGFGCKHIAAVLFEYRRATPATFATDILPARTSAAQSNGHAGRQIGLKSSPAPPVPTEAPLPYDVVSWLRSLDAAQEDETEDYPSSVRKRLLYVCDRGPHSGGLIVSLQSIELGRDGKPGRTVKRHHADQLTRTSQQPRFLRPSDRAILRQLANAAGGSEEFVLALQRILATGRGRWGAWDGPILTEGKPVGGELIWSMDGDGRQHAELALPGSLIALHLSTLWYVDPATGIMGPLETALPARLIRAMLSSPALPPAIAERVRDEMDRRWPSRTFPAPKLIAPPRSMRETLQPHLLLLAGELPFAPTGLAESGRSRSLLRSAPNPTTYRVALARLSWSYGRIRLPSGRYGQSEDRLVQHDGVLFQVVRDFRAEEQAAEQMELLGFAPIRHHYALPDAHPHAADLMLLDPDPAAWIEFVVEDIHRLRAGGWLVEIADDFPLRLVEPDGDISFEIQEHSGIDWFDLDLGVMVAGERISLVPALLDFIATSGLATATELLRDASTLSDADDQELPLLLPLADGRLLAIPSSRLQPILAPLLELFAGAELNTESGTLRLSRQSAGDLALLEAASVESGLAWSGGEALRTMGRQLREHGGFPPCPTPDGFGATLRAYQAHGLAWLQFLRLGGLGGVLADDMGLGKTVQALAHLAVEQEAGRLDLPALVVCPTSLVPNWHAEAARFAPSLRILVLHGPSRTSGFAVIGRHDLVITTYPLLSRDHLVLAAQEWHVVILDEAQIIKNPLATTSRLARTLQARQRLCLSGTPLENHLGELWSLFDFLAPGFLGSRTQFGRVYRGPIEKNGDVERQALLARRIAPFLLRRTKEEVASDLPLKTEIVETIEMSNGQRAIYEGIRLAMHAKVRAAVAKRGLAGSGIVILDALLKLRQACCDPRLLKLAAAKTAKAQSAKLARLLELLPPMLEEGRRVLLFSQFTSMLALIEVELTRLDVPYVLLTGDTRDRTVPVRRFQACEVPLFLISLKAGGVGLNLTAADTVIHYDPWWNPAVENQATDRAHRIGQDKPVFVHRLITAGTVEEKMETLKQRKQALADGVLGGTAGAMQALTEGDLEILFGPVGS